MKINSFLCIKLLKIAHTVQLHIDKKHRDTITYDVPNIYILAYHARIALDLDFIFNQLEI